jgi:hypothetical protein
MTSWTDPSFYAGKENGFRRERGKVWRYSRSSGPVGLSVKQRAAHFTQALPELVAQPFRTVK